MKQWSGTPCIKINLFLCWLLFDTGRAPRRKKRKDPYEEGMFMQSVLVGV